MSGSTSFSKATSRMLYLVSSLTKSKQRLILPVANNGNLVCCNLEMSIDRTMAS